MYVYVVLKGNFEVTRANYLRKNNRTGEHIPTDRVMSLIGPDQNHSHTYERELCKGSNQKPYMNKISNVCEGQIIGYEDAMSCRNYTTTV